MKRQSIVDEIKSKGLCLGCGFCESVCGSENVEMVIDGNGFYTPEIKKITPAQEAAISNICPGINVNPLPVPSKDHPVWGNIFGCFSGYSNDSIVRKTGSSGGIISAMAIYLLETKKVDCVLQVGGDLHDYTRNALKLSYSREDVISNASSRYAPALVFSRILQILENNDQRFCFIGKPCDISGLKNLIKNYPVYKDRFVCTISILCAGMPSFAGTRKIIDEFNPSLPIRKLVYRGNGWPGYFSFTDSEDREFSTTYNESWGKSLNKHLHLRCKLCPDGIGLEADLAVGDAWETDDGYPDFSEKDGLSLILARTENGVQLLKSAMSDGNIAIEDLPVEKIALMQPYQLARRLRVGARVLAFELIRHKKLNFKNLRLLSNSFKLPLKILIREFLGTSRRLLKNK